MTLVLIMLGGLTVGAGGWLCITAFTASTPSLARTVAYLHRPPERHSDAADRWTRFGARALSMVGGRVGGASTRRRLDLVGRAPEAHAACIAAAALAGFVTPLVVAATVSRASGSVAMWTVSLGLALACGGIAVLVVVADLEQRASAGSRDLRHQLSAYLDVLTMLLASNQGNEGALRLAADAGDGRLFVELRRRMLEAATAGRPAVTALAVLGRDLGVVELIEIAASASLATSQGAPVARSLIAKTESLRSSLQAEQEQDARVRTGKITFPLVAMGIVFIVAGLYPALASIRNT
ncbi:MAG: type II secretion system F family protein [Acidimicrobiia bacterium]